MANFIAKPQLGFGEAIKANFSNLTNFSGRSRRSEFWWNIIPMIVLSMVAGMFKFIPYSGVITQAVVMFFFLALTARRIQDTGHSAIWVYVSYAAGLLNQVMVEVTGLQSALESQDTQAIMAAVTNPIFGILGIVCLVTFLAILIFCIMDGKPEANKYGESPKYIAQ